MLSLQEFFEFLFSYTLQNELTRDMAKFCFRLMSLYLCDEIILVQRVSKIQPFKICNHLKSGLFKDQILKLSSFRGSSYTYGPFKIRN